MGVGGRSTWDGPTLAPDNVVHRRTVDAAGDWHRSNDADLYPVRPALGIVSAACPRCTRCPGGSPAQVARYEAHGPLPESSTLGDSVMYEVIYDSRGILGGADDVVQARDVHGGVTSISL